MQVTILGAGVSGISAGRMLKDQGCDVVILEKEATIGGLARSRFVNGILYDPHGGHILNSKHSKVMEWVFSIYPQENWKFTERNAKIFFSGKYVSYPFELSLCELDPDDTVECVYDFLLAQQGKEPENFRDWLLWNFGAGIANRYMIPYNEKIWAFPLENMETHWMRGKMPLPTKKEIIRSVILKDPKERKMPHSSFYYPFYGGIQTMINHIAESLTIKTNYQIYNIRQEDKKWIVNNEVSSDILISTIPIPCLPAVMDLPVAVKERIRDLKYNSLTTILFECPPTDITWLYIPSREWRSHRVGYQSALTPYAHPNPECGCGALEVIGSKFDITQDTHFLPEELGFTSVLDSEFTEYAYVIHDCNYRKNVNTIFDYFNTRSNFHLLGRWGTWNYKNMDLCMLDAMILVNRILQ